ncbi:MAG: NAD-dependent epimerase/dehydratase family protein [Candidatus Eisenbacteria bacterium]|uniref:NAD-dependent epimerase/dehydratase family protein n=1 Tax=Eiseniibacteriota bacterium TaxID=2212470 RepID=A0A933W3A3_UNCEI|nr:NAD-dependent epimerase/dehydratase family protein [Candidatus Eisenbacteria bacterium]
MAPPLEILLAGGSGLMGEPTARALLAAGHRLSVLSRGRRPSVVGAEAIAGDRTDARSLAVALGGRTFDLVVDFLAYDGADVSRLFDTPGLRIGRYVMISTGQVYLIGESRRPPFVEPDAGIPVMREPEQGTRAHANWVYGVGKRAAEAEVMRRREAGQEALALRLPVVQGAGDGSRRLWAYLQRMLDGGPILLPGGGGHPVRFVWAEDVGRAIAHLATGVSVPSFAYNVAMPDEPTLQEFLSMAATCLGAPLRTLEADPSACDAAGLDERMSPYSGPWCSRPDPGLARAELGFETTPSSIWLPEVVRAHLNETRPEPHPSYVQRAREIEFVRRLEDR